jgi:antitoxin component YwqK of YwqJK toxin-antitoxin module
MPSRTWEKLLPALVLIVAACSQSLGALTGDHRASAETAGSNETELRNGLVFRSGAQAPFDGVLVENWSAARRKAEVPVRRGKVHGVTRGWYEDGTREVEETFRGGVSHGWRTRWHPNGAIKSQVWIQHGTLCGSFREWHPNGRLARVTPMKAGQADGLVRGWEVDGSSGGLAVVKAGKPVGRE